MGTKTDVALLAGSVTRLDRRLDHLERNVAHLIEARSPVGKCARCEELVQREGD